MASAAELEGRRTPTFPGFKSEETQTFVGPDGNTIEVVKSIDKNALAILKRRGYKSQARALKEQEEAALAKIEGLDTSSQVDHTAGTETDGEGAREPSEEDDTRSPEVKKAARQRSR